MMMSLILAAAVAAQPAPPADAHSHMAGMNHEQHEAMKDDCCKKCCKDMGKDGHEGHAPAQPKSGE